LTTHTEAEMTCQTATSAGAQTPPLNRQRSRFNAVTHGLTAVVPVLPGESVEDYEKRRVRYKTCLPVTH
jgi:hypothetical protein